MAEETIITNVGEDDRSSVASEATMLMLLSAIEKMAVKAGYNPTSTRAKAEDQINKALKVNLDFLEKNSKALEEKTEAVDDATESVSRFSRGFGVLTAAFAGIAQTSFALTKELLQGGDRVSDFTKHFPIVGSLITPLTQFVESTVDNFRSLSSVGAGFGNNLEDLRRTAASARLPLDEFTSLIQNNSERLLFLGGTVTDSSRRFAEIAGELRGDDGLFGSLKAMGFTTEEVNEGLASYIGLQGRLGRLEGRTNAELATGAGMYLQQLDKLAKVTGRQRSEIEKDLETMNLDAGVRALEQQLIDQHGANSEQVRNFRQAQMQISALPSEMQDAARSMLLGLPNEEAAKLMAIGGSELNNALQQIAQGADPQILRDALVATGENLEQFSGTGQGAAQLIEGFRRAGFAFFDFSQDLIRIGQADLSDAEAEQNRRNFIINNLTRFDDAIRDIRTTIQTALFDSGVFDLVATSVASLASLLTSESGTTSIRNAIMSVTEFFNSFISDINSIGFLGAIKKSFVDLASGIMQEIKLQLFGGVRDTSDQQGRVRSQIQNLESRRRSLGPDDGLRGEDTSREMSALDAQIAQLRSRNLALAEQQGEEVEGMFSGIFSNLFGSSNNNEIEESLAPVNNAIRNLEQERNQLITQGEFGIVDENTSVELERINQGLRELNEQRDEINAERQSGFLGELFTLENIFSTGGVLLVGLAAGAAALALIGTKAALVAVAIGVGAGGIGYLLQQLTPVINSVFNGMETVINTVADTLDILILTISGGFTDAIKALTPMVDTVFNGISSVINSVGNTISGTLESISIGIANVIEKITEFRTSGTSATTDQIERLSQIEGGQLHAAAEGITAMKTALEGFATGSSGGFLDKIGSMFGRETAQQQQASVFERLASLGPGLTEVSARLSEIANINNIDENLNSLSNNLDSRSLREYNTELRRMLEILEDINQELSRDTRTRAQRREGELTANPAADALQSGVLGSNNGAETRLEGLNNIMAELLTVATQQLSILGDIEDNTDRTLDISRGGIISF